MKMLILDRELKKTQTKYKYTIEKKNITQQSSYNLSLETEKKLNDSGALQKTEGNVFCISDDFDIILGDGIKKILTKDYDNVKLNINFVHTVSSDGTTKFQILRRNNNTPETSWFTDLYDHNIEGNHFLIYIDKENENVIFDVNNPEIDNQYEYELIEPNFLKEKYIKWMEEQGYSGQSPKKYASALNTLNKKISEINENINFFEYTISEYPDIINKIKRSTEYQNIADRDNATTSNALKTFEIFLSELNNTDNVECRYRTHGKGYNKIYYGIPGCGKSYKIENEILKDISKKNIFRTTFYLDYTNSDFIGQIMPVVKNENITYEHIPGPFTKALFRALETNDMVYLIIEEINRGNAAAIFGDIFQLLDRKEEGYSRYPITNEFIEKYILKNKHYNIKGNVIIPSNLTIIATMNTSDQGVFPLDTAFKRRWELERVVDDNDSYKIDSLMVPYTNHTWKEFREKVNQTIQSKSKDGTVSVDKQLGRWFVKENMLTTTDNIHNKQALNRFVNNVLDYLYSDVCKFDKEKFFDDDYSFDHICRIIDNYKENQIYNLELKIFDENEN